MQRKTWATFATCLCSELKHTTLNGNSINLKPRRQAFADVFLARHSGKLLHGQGSVDLCGIAGPIDRRHVEVGVGKLCFSGSVRASLDPDMIEISLIEGIARVMRRRRRAKRRPRGFRKRP